MIKRIITKFLLVSLIAVVLISLHATIYIIYLANAGLNFREASFVNLFYLLALFFLEMPSKIVINLLGRKISLIVSAVLYGIGFGLYSLAYSLLSFICAKIFIAAGTTLVSKALKSWLTDSSRFCGLKGKSKGVFFSKGRMICFVKLIVGFGGAYLGVKNFSLPFAVASLGYWSLAISSLLIKEGVHLRGARIKKTSLIDFKTITQEGVAYVWQDDVMFIIIGLTIIIALGFPSLSMVWQPRYSSFLSGSHLLACLWLLISGGVLLSEKMTRPCYVRACHNWKMRFTEPCKIIT